MKVRDIFHERDTLRNMVEAFNYTPDDIVWSGDAARFSVGGERFTATVKPASPEDEVTYTYFFDPIPKVGNVDFAMEVEGGSKRTQDLTGIMRSSAFKVFASVAKVVAELRRRHGYQVLLCIAKRKESPTNFENRVRAYGTIVNRLAKMADTADIRLMTTDNETVYAAYDHILHDGMLSVQKYLGELNENR